MRFRVTSNQNITPLCQDKDLFHLVLVPENSSRVDYQPGDWLTLQLPNQQEWIEALLQALSLNGDETIELRRAGWISVAEALTHHLEISQLNPAILNKLQRQHNIGDWPDRQAMMDYAYGRDVFDLLEAFPILKTWGLEFLSLLAPLAPRYYSIASAATAFQNEIHLVVKHVCYSNTEISNRTHQGVASTAIRLLSSNDCVEGELKSNPTFKLPKDPNTPIIMLGAGTGIAPYIGFLQQRLAEKTTGENWLFFGETQQACSFLFEGFLTECIEQGQLNLFTAFSRDQSEKIYVQDRIKQQAEPLWALINQGAHIYICGSQYGLAEGVKQAWLELIMQFDQVDLETAQQTWQAWRKQKRLQLDVY